MNGTPDLPLRDVHAPPPVSWWPPAPGWWLLAALAAAAVLLGWWWLRRRRRRRLAAVTLARRELEAIRSAFQAGEEPAEIVRRLSVLLRRLSISVYPRAETAALTGTAWLEFLDAPLQRPAFSEGPGRLLAEAPYRPSVPADDVGPLLDLAGEWIRAVDRERGGAAA